MVVKFIEGESVDILDQREELYNPGQIVKVHYVSSNKSDVKSVRVRFLGWDGTFDEEINRENLGRLCAQGTHVKKCKAWVKLAVRGVSTWPCYVYIRKPVENSAIGIANLKIEKKVLINPCGLVACPLLPYKHGDENS
mmetsp:Transcript_21125/g.20467  ORF Transcript_21125/g.20467 Transcript_21125/m.20467 type:complete len:138 (+) Transcript_21125:119-532(+)